jgi:hypothetical protein
MLVSNLLVPYRRLELQSSLSPSEVRENLSRVVEPRQWFRFGSLTDNLFEGTVSERSFAIQRIISYRNGFLPQIRCDFAPSDCGTKLTITIRPDWVAIVFMSVWFSLVGVDCIDAFRRHAFGDIPLGMLAFGVALTLGSFLPEAIKAERLLTTLVRG